MLVFYVVLNTFVSLYFEIYITLDHSSHLNESPIYPVTEESECVSEDLSSNLEDQIIAKPPLQPKSSGTTRGEY